MRWSLTLINLHQVSEPPQIQTRPNEANLQSAQKLQNRHPPYREPRNLQERNRQQDQQLQPINHHNFLSTKYS